MKDLKFPEDGLPPRSTPTMYLFVGERKPSTAKSTFWEGEGGGRGGGGEGRANHGIRVLERL